MIKCRKGKAHLMGLGFTLEVDRPVAGMAVVHSDNVIGDPASLSDTRLKQNQSIVPIETLTNVVLGMVRSGQFRENGPKMVRWMVATMVKKW